MNIPRNAHLVKLTPAFFVLTLSIVSLGPASADGRMPGGMGMGMGMRPGSEMGMPKSTGKSVSEPMEGMEVQPSMEPAPSSAAAANTSSDVTPDSLPGFAGAPEIYHMGATGFFLDHPEHITLTAQQRKLLETSKAAAQKDQLRYQQQITAGENSIWSLTGMAEPDATAIEQKVQEVEALRTKQRMAYIEAVGRAAATLTAIQRKQLVGQTAPEMAATADLAAGKKSTKPKAEERSN